MNQDENIRMPEQQASRGRSRRKPGHPPKTGTAGKTAAGAAESSSGEKKPSGRKKKAFLAGAIVLAAAAGAYLVIGSAYREAFFNGTVINGMNVSGKSVDEVKSMIAQGTEGYILVLEERGGRSESIAGEAVSLRAEFDGSLEEIMDSQNPLAWLPAWISGKEYEIQTLVSYDREKLDRELEALGCMDEEKAEKPENASISSYEAGTGYVIVPEKEGSEVDGEKLKEAAAQAVSRLETTLSLEDAGVYREPEIRSDDQDLAALLEQYNRYAGVTVTYTFGEKKEILDGEIISQWLYDDGSQVIISDEGAAEYIQILATKYNTAYRAKSLKTSYGKEVTISRGSYGWRINQSAEKEALMEMIRSGESGSREPEYSQKAASHGENDYGDTYVEINLTAQHLFFYKDGKLLVESDFVSGNTSKGWTTPPGAYPLTYKERNATLKGEGYATPVSYWMPFNGGIGLHDAGWRSSFGGTIYKTNGSHGCINLPPSVAKIIYENISQGDPVLCYELAGTEQTVTTKADGTPTETAPAETKPAETAPAETKPAETAPAETKPAETKPAETAPAETKPAETAPAETKPAGPAGPGTGGGSSSETAAGPGEGL